nr:FxsA family protein [Tessaracoccus coleopterorum]
MLVYVIAEVAALIWVSGQIGWWTLAVLVLTSLLGIFLLGREWTKTWGKLSESLRSGQLPSGQLADASLVIAGGILLILPGLLSDIVGALLLLPFTRPFIRSAISWWANRTLQRSGAAPTVIKGRRWTSRAGR